MQRKVFTPIFPKREDATPAPSRRVRFVIDATDAATAIDANALEATHVTKFVQDGQLFILRDNVVYTVQGERVKWGDEVNTNILPFWEGGRGMLIINLKMITTMRKTYIVPQSEVMRFSSLLLQDPLIPIVNHSGGGGGFSNPDDMD